MKLIFDFCLQEENICQTVGNCIREQRLMSPRMKKRCSLKNEINCKTQTSTNGLQPRRRKKVDLGKSHKQSRINYQKRNGNGAMKLAKQRNTPPRLMFKESEEDRFILKILPDTVEKRVENIEEMRETEYQYLRSPVWYTGLR